MIKKTVFILSVSSDIGIDLAKHYLQDGWKVVGTYRTFSKQLIQIQENKNFISFPYDIENHQKIDTLIKQCQKHNVFWNIFISCVGEPRPLTNFFETDFDAWEKSVRINSVSQLRILHALYPFRTKRSHVIFFAGGGINKSVVNFSAYTIGKIMLIKMCEYLDAENSDVSFFIIGPGWTKTKTHHLIVDDPQVSPEKKKETVAFLKTQKGTSLDYIYDCIDWLSHQNKSVVGGRNFSIVYDPLHLNKRKKLSLLLRQDHNLFKLRRFSNDKINQLSQN